MRWPHVSLFLAVTGNCLDGVNRHSATDHLLMICGLTSQLKIKLTVRVLAHMVRQAGKQHKTMVTYVQETAETGRIADGVNPIFKVSIDKWFAQTSLLHIAYEIHPDQHRQHSKHGKFRASKQCQPRHMTR